MGIAWNGSRFYITGGQNDKVYEYNPDGTYTGFNFAVGSQDNEPTGITAKAGAFYVAGDTTARVYEYNSAGSYTGFNFSVGNQDTEARKL